MCVVSLHFEQLCVELVRCVSCTLLSLLISLGTSLITLLSLNVALSKHCREDLTPILPEESFRPRFGMLLVDT